MSESRALVGVVTPPEPAFSVSLRCSICGRLVVLSPSREEWARLGEALGGRPTVCVSCAPTSIGDSDE